MKRIALILFASVLALGSLQANNAWQPDEQPDTVAAETTLRLTEEYDELVRRACELVMTYPIGPEHTQQEVQNALVIMNKIAKLYGQEDEVMTEVVRQPESGALVSSINIVPFVANIDELNTVEHWPSTGEYEETWIQELIEEAKVVFRSCNISYSCGHLDGKKTGTYYKVLIAPGKSLNLLTPGSKDNLIYMEVKNKDNPTMRDFYAVTWRVEDDAVIYGALYFITNRRPDLIEKDEQTAAKLEFTQSPAANSALPSVHISIRQRLALLEKLGAKYEEDIKQLQRDLFNADTSKEKRRIRKQIKPLNKKRQEVLDEMHHIIMNYKKSEKI